VRDELERVESFIARANSLAADSKAQALLSRRAATRSRLAESARLDEAIRQRKPMSNNRREMPTDFEIAFKQANRREEYDVLNTLLDIFLVLAAQTANYISSVSYCREPTKAKYGNDTQNSV